MGLALKHETLSEAEYLESEERAPRKREYVAGKTYVLHPVGFTTLVTSKPCFSSSPATASTSLLTTGSLGQPLL